MIEVLDVKGLRCPLPVLKARKALRSVPAGACLEVLATDPASVIDFRHFCDTTAYELVDQSETAGVFTFRIKNPLP
jgi:tRNA 2-thiouridine synthesizing protein A